jgi:DNA-binding TFAR19-related protein (PDSD5 family)
MVDYQYLTNPKHWRDRAEQTLAKARQELRPEARDRLQKVALEYKQLAERAERSLSSTVEPSDAEIVV